MEGSRFDRAGRLSSLLASRLDYDDRGSRDVLYAPSLFKDDRGRRESGSDSPPGKSICNLAATRTNRSLKLKVAVPHYLIHRSLLDNHTI